MHIFVILLSFLTLNDSTFYNNFAVFILGFVICEKNKFYYKM